MSHDTPRREASLNELQLRLNEALQKLSESHRAVVIMHDIQGMTHADIAKAINCSEGTVRSRLFYARQQLQGLLGDYL
jgi:RNA polymerase sigma-70 factor (ECF subfamily)